MYKNISHYINCNYHLFQGLCDTKCSCDNDLEMTVNQHIILSAPIHQATAESAIVAKKIRESGALNKDDIKDNITSELVISLNKQSDNLTDDHKLSREIKERHSKSDNEKPTGEKTADLDSKAAASGFKASLPRRRLPEAVLKSSGSNHKITVYVKYEEQLKEGCVDSDGKYIDNSILLQEKKLSYLGRMLDYTRVSILKIKYNNWFIML